MKRTRTASPNNLKTLLAAYRVTNESPANDLEDAIDGLEVNPGVMIFRVLKAVLADMRAEDEAAGRQVGAQPNAGHAVASPRGHRPHPAP